MKIVLRILFVASWILLALGVGFKSMHWPFANQMLFLAFGTFAMHGMLFQVRHMRSAPALAFLYLAIDAFGTYAIARVMMWEWRGFVFWFALAFTVVAVILHVVKRTQVGFPQVAGVLLFAGFLGLSFLSPSKVYHFTHAATLESGEDYRGWDKYSWLLYQEGDYAAALEANARAQSTFDYYTQNVGPDYYEGDYATLIPQHRIQIEKRAWDAYQ